MVGAGENYVTPFAIALNAPTYFIGLLSTLPLLIGSIFEIFSLNIFRLILDRKKIILIGILFQSIVWFFFSIFALNPSSFSLNTLLFLFTAYFIFGMVPSPLWNSWISDLVKKSDLAEFFSKRNRYLLFSQFFTIITAGYLLNTIFKDNPFLGFFILFLVAFISRLFCLYFVNQLPDIRRGEKEILKPFSIRSFLLDKHFSSYKNFSIFNFLIILGTNIASPFFHVFMLKILNFDYFTWSLTVFATGISKIFAYPYWEMALKVFGQKVILLSSAIAISLVPLFWIFSSDPLYIFLINLFTGFCWAGYDLVASLLLLSPNSLRVKITYTSFFELLKGIGSVGGAILGAILLGFFSETLKLDIYLSFYLIFFISFLTRFLPVTLFYKKLERYPFTSYSHFLKQIFFSYFIKWFYKNKETVFYPFLLARKKVKQSPTYKAFKSLLKEV
ncbi:MAG: MFS transporter [Candidatus Micrarchaeota archaeon]|nr:MFS transporter [Candidatus Micrarchaeota archaeon]